MVFLNGVVLGELLLYLKAPRAVYQVSVNIVFTVKTMSNRYYLNYLLRKNGPFLAISRSE